MADRSAGDLWIKVGPRAADRREGADDRRRGAEQQNGDDDPAQCPLLLSGRLGRSVLPASCLALRSGSAWIPGRGRGVRAMPTPSH
jgi:hypothetical protein